MVDLQVRTGSISGSLQLSSRACDLELAGGAIKLVTLMYIGIFNTSIDSK